MAKDLRGKSLFNAENIKQRILEETEIIVIKIISTNIIQSQVLIKVVAEKVIHQSGSVKRGV